MQTLIVYAHPDNKKSHNSMVLKEVRSFLESGKLPYRVIDLYAEKFDPSLPASEWEESGAGEDVRKYQEMVREADRLIFIYPIWWYTYPAIMKGFFDRVFASDFAFNFRKEPRWMKVSKSLFRWFLSVRLLYPLIYCFLPVEQHLKGKKALVINTYGGDESGFRLYGRAPEYAADKAVLEFCGVRPVYRVNWYNARHHKDPMPGKVASEIRSKLASLMG